MSVCSEIAEACEVYRKNTGERACFIVLPIDRARRLIEELIDVQGAFTPVHFIEAQQILDDTEFAKRFTGTTFLGVQILVLTSQMILGGWANDQPGVTGYKDGGS